MATPLPIINIKAQANHHAMFLLLIGWVLLLLTLLVSQYYWQTLRLVLMFIILVAIVVMITGLAKYLQPKFSYQLTPETLEYRHIYGEWHLAWQQIQAIKPIREVHGLNTIDLPYIGIRLINLEVLAQQISPRLANRLIHEQKPLLKFAFVQQSLSLEQIQIDFTPYPLQSGTQVSGPIGAFLHHCQNLQSALGYHLYLPETSMDRELDDFYQLLSRCQHASKHYNEDSTQTYSHPLNQ
jgi:energy-coupling factor transporter transmembrane protein EcfT